MFKSNHLTPTLRPTLVPALRKAATMAILVAGFGYAAAQTTTTSDTSVKAQSPLTLQTPAVDTFNAPLFSSSSEPTAAAAAGATTEASIVPTAPNFAEYMQYGGGQRRRYGAPRYRGSNTNADGSPKYTFFVGAGFTQPVGNTWKYLTPSYAFGFGGGRNFNRKVGLLLQFDYDHMGFTGQTITNQSIIYFGQTGQGLDGSSHVWSFTLDPTLNLFSTDTWGAYAVAGVGFFHKVADFTLPGTACDIYGYCYTANQIVDHYTSNAPGFDGGFGVTYKFSRFSNERFYGEIRYVFVDNSQRQGIVNTAASLQTVTTSTTDFYPANSNRTTYFPVKFGLRF